MTLRFNIIGCGRLGKNIAYAFVQNNIAQLNAICNRRIHSSLQAVKLIGSGTAVKTIAELPDADLTFITVPDDKIEQIVEELARFNPFINTQHVVHCNGALSSLCLSPLAELGCQTASVHPP